MINQYNKLVKAIDNLYEINYKTYVNYKTLVNDWKYYYIHSIVIQSTNIVKSILRDIPGSKFTQMDCVNELTLIGSSTRLVRDLYITLIYLKYCDKPNEDMRICWEYQILHRHISTYNYSLDFAKEATEKVFLKLNAEKEQLRKIIDKMPNFSTKGALLIGKEEKMISSKELYEIKNFKSERLEKDFIYLSQFAHSTAFAMGVKRTENNLISVDIIIKKLFSYYLGITSESLDIFFPDYEETDKIRTEYLRNCLYRWNE